ncbi:hypothetical protein [Allostreptomyces psammosilenae]|uniref:Uncharacterized protein n=1 Tax=Allostreptomyces psammosilenae TaxID=1892865 RepID=A0A853A133_9ACTN|nr:hypothetical protein [Allostreptomyces psammosilenae]NYI04521.1 hypothetical protein [Allostreptomyces psammosilenae]
MIHGDRSPDRASAGEADRSWGERPGWEEDERTGWALREALTADLPVGPPPLREMLVRGRVVRRRRRALLGVVVGASAALVLGFTGTLVLSGQDPAESVVVPAAPASSPPPPAGEETSAGLPRVVRPGERIEAGGGFLVWLTAQDEHVIVDPEMPELEQGRKITDGNVPEDTIGLRSFARPDGTLFTGAYRGDGDLHRVTLASQGVTVEAQVITLPGAPGWAAYHVYSDQLPPPGTDPDARVTVTAYAADGSVLATFP